MESNTEKRNSRITINPEGRHSSSEVDILGEMVRVREEAIERTAQSSIP